jgi:hypothetical protein
MHFFATTFQGAFAGLQHSNDCPALFTLKNVAFFSHRSASFLWFIGFEGTASAH